MTELTKAKRRMKRLEKCLDDVLRMAAARDEELLRSGRWHQPEGFVLRDIENRIGRTLKR